jgi:glycogen operon protein
MTGDYSVSKGAPTPLGPTVGKTGVNFALFSAHANAVSLCLFSKTGKREIAQIPLTAKTGDIWHGFVEGLDSDQLYGYRVDGPYAPHEGHRFNRHKLLIDPYAKQLFGEFILDDAVYGFDVDSADNDLSFNTQDSAPFIPKCVVGDVVFDWGNDAPPRTNLRNTILYECHIKGATKLNADVPRKMRGTVEGLSSPAMIKHLMSLGVTTVEVLPLQSFMSEPRLTEMGLSNYWGYNPVNYFSPHTPYLGPEKSKSIQTMVKTLHATGIEVILDVVYNHTAESWELGPTLSYRGIDNKSYYHLKHDQRFYENHTGCGNSLNMTNPAVLDLTIASLRYWVETYHIDGFRFDLGPTMGRNPFDFNRDAIFFKALQSDPILSKVKLISEPWDIGPNGYQLGNFPNGWSEWNDQYRDSVRSFWRGDQGAHRELAGGLLGSAHNFDHDRRTALSSVNFITSHDGFTLQDVVSFNDKHNLANGENNRDGHGHNLSDNMGFEGPTEDGEVEKSRRRRKLNMLATLLLSQGMPMLLAGDEFGQSQDGNNNAYCQDNEITWLNWSAREDSFQTEVSKIIGLRQKFPHFRQAEFLHGEEIGQSNARNVAWINASGNTMAPSQWEEGDRPVLGMLLSLEQQGSVLVIFNRGDCQEITLPTGDDWKLEYSTGKTELDGMVCNHSKDSVAVLSCTSLAVPLDIAHAAINKQARRAGIISEFRDISGHVHTSTHDSKAAILKAMNWPIPESAQSTPNKNPIPVYGAQHMRQQGKVWGLTSSLYGLRSKRNWGIGDFEDLASLAELMAEQGADFVGINPVHALFPGQADLYAPYSPSSRDFLNIMHIAPDKIDEISSEDLNQFYDKLEKARAADFVDYDAVHTLKFTVFEMAYKRFHKLPSNSTRRKSFKAFLEREGEALRLHAIFDTIFETLPPALQTYDGYKNFPEAYQSPHNPAVEKFAKDNADRIQFFLYLQWVAHCQLSDTQNRAKTAGMSIGLYLDFAVGVVPGGSDAWRRRTAFADNISLGAPGDAANPEGQLWNLLPFDPHSLAANNFEPYRSSLRRTMQQAGAVRIDHILGHLRSFWIPQRKDGRVLTGSYVTYPLEGLLAMIAEESQAAKCIVIGEDLGTIPDGLRQTMHQYELMGCGIVIIERDSHGRLLPFDQTRELSLTAFSNHDFPTLAGFWAGADFEWRAALGISSDKDSLRGERKRRDHDKNFLNGQAGQDRLETNSLSPETAAVLHAALARAPAMAVAVQLEDLLMQTSQPNVPGTTEEQPNWRRKYAVNIETIRAHPSGQMILSAIREARPAKRSK